MIPIGSRRALLATVPPWVMAAYGPYGVIPDLAAHFDINRYFVKGVGEVPLSAIVSVSRASIGDAQNAAGVCVPFAANVLRVTDQGALIEEARTNKCTNYNANPTDLTNVTKSGDAAATLTVVDDTAALLAAGLQNIATSGKVYKLDNSAGVGAAQANMGGATGNTNQHCISVYMRGSGTGLTFLNGDVTSLGGVLTGVYARYGAARASVNSTRYQYIQASPGAVVYFTLNQLEEGAFVTSPIVVAGASAGRAADVSQFIGLGLTAAVNAKALYSQTSGIPTLAIAPRIFAWDTASTAQGNVAVVSSTALAVQAPPNSATVTLGSGTVAGPLKLAAGFDAISMTGIANGGTKGTNANAWGVGTVPYLGSIGGGGRALNSCMLKFAFHTTIKTAFDGMTAP